MKRAISLALAIGAVPVLAHSQSVTDSSVWTTGPYGSLYGGASFLDDADNVGDPFLPGAGNATVESESDTGFVLGATAGYGFENFIARTRFEADVAYRENDLDEATLEQDGGLGVLLGLGDLDGLSTSDIHGEVRSLSGLMNVWVDVLPSNALAPYVGGGLGGAFVSMNDVSALGVGLADDTDFVFAWQIGGGAAYQFTPNVAATVDYRWFNAEDPTFDLDPTGGDFESEYSTHNVMVGLRYMF